MKKITIPTLLMLTLVSVVNAQVRYHANYTKVAVSGTSTFHDWDMASEKGTCDLSFNFNGANIAGLSSLTFTVDAESLKSHHSGMDKNAYKALNTGQFPQITFTSNYANIRPNGSNSYVVSSKGKLTIAGVTRDVWLAGVTTMNPSDASIQISGSMKIKMSEYNVAAPSFMFGAMKTGDEVTVSFKVTMKK